MDKKRKNDYYSVAILICLLLIFSSNFYTLFIKVDSINNIICISLKLIFILVALRYIIKNNLEKPKFNRLKVKSLLFIPFILIAFSNIITAYFMDSNKLTNIDKFDIILSLFISILTAFTEELVFRGVLVGEVRKDTSKTKTILYSSMIFGGVHLLNISSLASIPMTLAQAFYTFFFGLFLTFSYYYSENLIIPFILHFLFNFINGDIAGLFFNLEINLLYFVCNIFVGLIAFIYLLFLYKLFDKEEKLNASRNMDL